MTALAINKTGSGSKSLFVFPGWISPLEENKKFLKLLSHDYTVYSINLPGYLNNKDTDKYLSFSDLAQEIYRKVCSINGEIVYVGFSMGCRLIMTMDKIHRNDKAKKIFIGSPVSKYNVPLWAKPILSNTLLTNLFRRSKLFKKYVVNKALQTINRDQTLEFNSDVVSLTGAYDSLLGLIQSEVEFEKYSKNSKFIYGEKDLYLNEAKRYNPKNLIIIPGVGHDCITNNEQNIYNAINTWI